MYQPPPLRGRSVFDDNQLLLIDPHQPTRNVRASVFRSHGIGVDATWFMYCNFACVHQTLRVTPAMEAGISNYVCTIEELCGLLLPPRSALTKGLS